MSAQAMQSPAEDSLTIGVGYPGDLNTLLLFALVSNDESRRICRGFIDVFVSHQVSRGSLSFWSACLEIPMNTSSDRGMSENFAILLRDSNPRGSQSGTKVPAYTCLGGSALLHGCRWFSLAGISKALQTCRLLGGREWSCG
jgi:hypothetical protein